LTNIIDNYKAKAAKTSIEIANEDFERKVKPNLIQDLIFPTNFNEIIEDREYIDINIAISSTTSTIIDVLNISGYTNLEYGEKRIVGKWLLDTIPQREIIFTNNEIEFNTYRLSLLLNLDQRTLLNNRFKDSISGTTLDGNYYSGTTGHTKYGNSSLLVNEFNVYSAETKSNIDNVSGSSVNIDIFNTYTGETQIELDGKLSTGYTPTWGEIDFTGSTLADIEVRNASDISYLEPSWNITSVSDGLNKLTDYIENTQGSGRISPKNVLKGTLTNTLIVSGGTGFINYPNYHKKITWSGDTFDTSSGYAEGLYYVYVDTNSTIQISITAPNVNTTIPLGIFFWGGFIGVIQQSGIFIESATNGIIDYALRQGIFIYDDGGRLELLSGDTLGVVSSPCKVQLGLISEQLDNVSSDDASSLKFLNYFNSADFGWALNYHFSFGINGRIPTDRWNDITKNSYVPLTGYTTSYINGSNIVTSSSDLTSHVTIDDYIYESGDTDIHMNPVSAITWNGSITTITLETPYSGNTVSGTTIVNRSLPHLPVGKYVKHQVIRSTDGLMYLIFGQTYFDTEDDALSGPLPAIPSSLLEFAIKIAYIVNIAGETDLNGKIYDIRPLPYQYREGGQVGGGTTITNHGDLQGLNADDHLQYLKTDGSRNITSIQRYQSQPTFTTDLDLTSKKYVDDSINDGLETKLDLTGGTITGSLSTLGSGAFGGSLTVGGSIVEDGIPLATKYLQISNFNTYSGNTDTRLDDIEDDIESLSAITSGLTGTYVENSVFTGYTATTNTTLNDLQTQIDALSGITGMSTVQARRTASLSLTTSFQNITYDVTDIESNSVDIDHDGVNTERININKSGLYYILFDGQAENNAGTSEPIELEIVKNVGSTLLNGGNSTISIYNGDIQKLDKHIYVNLVAGDYIFARIRTTYTTTAQIIPSITFGAVLLEGVRGEKGSDGETGSGSTIKVFEDGVNVHPTGGTFSIINFDDGFGLSANTTQVNVSRNLISPICLLSDSVGGQNLNVITPLPINWDQQDIINTNYYTHGIGNSTITVLRAGLYEISFNVNYAKDSSNTRATTGVQIRLNGNNVINQSLVANYTRNSANDDGTNTLPPYPISLIAGDVIEIVGYRLGDNANIITKAGASFIRINYLG